MKKLLFGCTVLLAIPFLIYIVIVFTMLIQGESLAVACSAPFLLLFMVISSWFGSGPRITG